MDSQIKREEERGRRRWRVEGEEMEKWNRERKGRWILKQLLKTGQRHIVESTLNVPEHFVIGYCLFISYSYDETYK